MRRSLCLLADMQRFRVLPVIGCALTFTVLSLTNMPATAATKPSLRAYIGTYTGPKSQGIYIADFDPATGKLGTPELAAETRNPTFLALHPKQPWLYAVGEVSDFEGKRAGSVSAFRIEEQTGKLTLLNQQPSGGSGPCHLALDATGQCVLVANYGSGSVAALPVQSDGQLRSPSSMIQHEGSSVNRERQSSPHGHHITPSPDNAFALACDLGLDKILVYRLDCGQAVLKPGEPPFCTIPPGSGPRHLAFDPRGKFVYLINELSSTVTVLAYDSRKAALRELQTISTLPDDFHGRSTCAEIAVHPSGKYVYGSNRGHDSIAVFAADARTGHLSFVEHQSTQGKNPRHFALDPAGKWLLAENQDSNNIVLFRVDPKTGRLSPTGQTVQVGSPVCIVFVKSGA